MPSILQVPARHQHLLFKHLLLAASFLPNFGSYASNAPNIILKSQNLRQQLAQPQQSPIHTWPMNTKPSQTQTQSQISAFAASTQGAFDPLLNAATQNQLQFQYQHLTPGAHITLQIGLNQSSSHNDNIQATGKQNEAIKQVLDGSAAGFYMGNWDLALGAVDRWWGPAWVSPLLLSNNARPIPALSIDRLAAIAPDFSLLRWVGPWRLNTFLGQLESDRFVPSPYIWGVRFSMMPLDGFEIGFNRTAMFGGEGRNLEPRDVFNVLIGNDNAEDQPGNQLGGIDLSYRFQQALGANDLGHDLYFELAGEDEANAFPTKKFTTLGYTGFITQNPTATRAIFGQPPVSWHYLVEFSNTTAGSFDNNPIPNVTYKHHIYQSGYTHYGRSLGSPLGGDAQALTLGLWRDQALLSNQQRPNNMGVWLSQKRFPEQEDLLQVSLWRESNCGLIICKFVIESYDQPLRNGIINPAGDYFALRFELHWTIL